MQMKHSSSFDKSPNAPSKLLQSQIEIMMWVYSAVISMAFALQSSLTNLVATLLRPPVINALHNDYEASFTACPVCSYKPTPKAISSRK